MATANKILGQSKPAAATPTTLYTVPALTQANVNLFIANQDGTNPDKIRIAITKSGVSLAAAHYIAYDMNIGASSTLNFTGIALALGDFITVYSLNADCSFVATGIEIT